MKAKSIPTMLALLCLGGGIATPTTLLAKNQTQPTTSPQPTSVLIQRVEILDSPDPRPGFKKLVMTLANNSDKEVVNFIVMLVTGPDGRSGSGLSGPAPGKEKFLAHSTIILDRLVRDSGEIKPFLRAVVFDDGTFEGDENSAKSFLIRREEQTRAIARYESRLLAVDTSATPALDVAKIREDLITDLREFTELDSLPPAKYEERYDRIRLQIRRGVLTGILSEINNLAKLLKDQPQSGIGFGKRAVDNLKARN